MELAANLNDDRIRPDFDAAQMEVAGGSDNVAFIAGSKSMVVDNYQPVIQRPGKAPQNERFYVSDLGNNGCSNFIWPSGVGKKWVAAFRGP